MKWLNELFSKKQEVRETVKKDIPRDPRFRLIAEHTAQLEVEKTDLGQPKVFNLSRSGMGLLCEKDSPILSLMPGTEISADLIFSGKKQSINFEVVHKTGNVCGCKFLKPSFDFVEKLENYFYVEFRAAEMCRVKRHMLKDEEKGEPNWILGDDNYELYYVNVGAETIAFRLALETVCLDWEKGSKIKVSRLESNFSRPDKNLNRILSHADSYDISFNQKIVRMMPNIPSLPEATKEFVLNRTVRDVVNGGNEKKRNEPRN